MPLKPNSSGDLICKCRATVYIYIYEFRIQCCYMHRSFGLNRISIFKSGKTTRDPILTVLQSRGCGKTYISREFGRKIVKIGDPENVAKLDKLNFVPIPALGRSTLARSLCANAIFSCEVRSASIANLSSLSGIFRLKVGRGRLLEI